MRTMHRIVVLLALATVVARSGLALAATTERISVSTSGKEADEYSSYPSVATNGRYVAFTSLASNLVPNDTNGTLDIFVHDRETGVTERVNLSSAGEQTDSESQGSAISGDGRYVTFASMASNLVPDDTNDSWDVFVRDRETGRTTRVSIASDGTQGNMGSALPSISADGRFIAFSSGATNLVVEDTNGSDDVFVHDRQTGETTRVSVASGGREGDRAGFWPSISGAGRFVAFLSDSTDLVSGDTNGCVDVFVHDRETGATSRLSVTSDGAHANGDSWWRPVISADGRFVAFESVASNLVADDTNGFRDIFLHDRETGQTSRVSVAADGEQLNSASYSPAISADGRYVAFESESDPGVNIFLHDRAAGRTTRVSIAWDGSAKSGGGSIEASIDGSGRYVAFGSYASDLVPGDANDVTDVFLRDRLTFEDVPLDHWAFYEVGACDMASIVQGYPDGRYCPETSVSRDQMAVYIARALTGGSVPSGPVQVTFPDVPTDFWAYDDIECAVANDVVQGYADGKYHPDWTLSRGQMAVFIARSVVTPTGEAGLESYYPPVVPTFLDVPTFYWCYKHVEYLAAEGIVSGYPDDLYHPGASCRRDQMAVYVARGFGLPQ